MPALPTVLASSETKISGRWWVVLADSWARATSIPVVLASVVTPGGASRGAAITIAGNCDAPVSDPGRLKKTLCPWISRPRQRATKLLVTDRSAADHGVVRPGNRHKLSADPRPHGLVARRSGRAGRAQGLHRRGRRGDRAAADRRRHRGGGTLDGTLERQERAARCRRRRRAMRCDRGGRSASGHRHRTGRGTPDAAARIWASRASQLLRIPGTGTRQGTSSVLRQVNVGVKALADYHSIIARDLLVEIRELAAIARGSAGLPRQRDELRRRGRRDPLQPRAAHERRGPQGRLAGDVRPRRVLQRHQGDAQRVAGVPARHLARRAAHLRALQPRQRRRSRRRLRRRDHPRPATDRDPWQHLGPRRREVDLALPHRPFGSQPPGTGVLAADDGRVRRRGLPHGPIRPARHDSASGDHPTRNRSAHAEEHGAVGRGRSVHRPSVRP